MWSSEFVPPIVFHHFAWGARDTKVVILNDVTRAEIKTVDLQDTWTLANQIPHMQAHNTATRNVAIALEGGAPLAQALADQHRTNVYPLDLHLYDPLHCRPRNFDYEAQARTLRP